MRLDSGSEGQDGRSFIEQARRAQIVEAAIQVVAERGYVNTSLARVAEHAGISKGVINYHFAGKDELMAEVVRHVFTTAGRSLTPRLQAQPTATATIREYVFAQADYMSEHRAHVVAFGQIVSNMRDADGVATFGPLTSEPVYQQLEEIFRHGQDNGELRAFDPRPMAVSLQAAVDAMAGYWFTHPDHDLGTHAAELADLFEQATRTAD